MLVGVVADTHDNLPMIKAALGLLGLRGVEAMLHAGDYVAPFALEALLAPGLPLLGVLGNNDGERAGLQRLCATVYESPHCLELGGRTIVLAHDLRDLQGRADDGADLCVFAHTHRPEVRRGETLTLNPGECGGWLTGRSTVALVELDTLDVEILDVRTGKTVLT